MLGPFIEFKRILGYYMSLIYVYTALKEPHALEFKKQKTISFP